MANRKESELEFALTLIQSQLEDSLGIVGNKILNELEEDIADLDDDQALKYCKTFSKNPFELIERVGKELKSEYSEFSGSDECRRMVEKMMEVIDDDSSIDEVKNKIEEVINDGKLNQVTKSPSKKLQ